MKYRTRAEIVLSMLRAMKESPQGIKRTRLMYMSFLSYSQVAEYTEFLEQKGLLTSTPSPEPRETFVYRITEKGIKALEPLESIEEFVKAS